MDEAEIDVRPNGLAARDLNATLATSDFYNTVVTYAGTVRAAAGQFPAALLSKDHERMNSIPPHEIARAKILVEKDVPIL